MKVRAIMLGYYKNRRRKIGEVFDIPDTTYPKGHEREGEVISFSKVWMEKVKETPAKKEVETPKQVTPGEQRDKNDVI